MVGALTSAKLSILPDLRLGARRHNEKQVPAVSSQIQKTDESTQLERRLHTRHRARTTVYITTGGKRKLCKAVNLSATGVFIETTNLGLRKGQHVELAFAINLGTVTKLHRRTAVVAHVSRGGTGLMMEAYSSARAN